jgi:hypothetical protein
VQAMVHALFFATIQLTTIVLFKTQSLKLAKFGLSKFCQNLNMESQIRQHMISGVSVCIFMVTLCAVVFERVLQLGISDTKQLKNSLNWHLDSDKYNIKQLGPRHLDLSNNGEDSYSQNETPEFNQNLAT